MFSSGNDKKPHTGSDMPSIIAKGLVISGNLECDGELQVDGIVVGDIRAQKLTLGETSHVTGNIDVDSLLVNGKVDGNIRALEVSITESAMLKGDVTSSSLSIEPGAVVDGFCKHHDNPRSSAETVALFDNSDAKASE